MKKSLTALMLAALAAPAAVLAARGEADAAPPPVQHEVRMVAAGTTYRFEPANLTVRAGDRVRFTTASGGPHNVAFDPAKIPDAAEPRIAAGMPDQMSPLSGPFIINAGDSYTVSFAGVPAGRYEFYCLPHMAMSMKGVVTVQ